MLHQFIVANRAEIIRRCRDRAVARSAAPPAERGIDHGVPMFLDQVVDALRRGRRASPEMSRTAVEHGHDLLLQGFTVSQVVHGYGDVCQAITGLAVDLDVAIGADDFRALNHCLDDAIAAAVTEYGREGDRCAITDRTARERFGYFAHELRNLVDTSIVALEVLKKDSLGVGGSTGAVLQRSLMALRALVGRSLAEVRLTRAQHVERLSVAEVVGEAAAAAALDADARGIRLAVVPVQAGVGIEADRQVLAAVIGNLLQNALKFTQPRTTVTLRATASAERVLIEVRDECLGLPEGCIDELFRPFEQRGADRTGLGLGLAFSRWGVEANHGRISARNLPEKGCVFTVDLPRAATASASAGDARMVPAPALVSPAARRSGASC